ncbi:hypothetical protein [uncultured Winogradskyella sp.]|uniref:hypothetical protein n=1 Tax=uncultured Winogradskyella sp. TaxID=395353 RepID=UPI00261A1FFD|nr:hypothetical protein [uncultured Winogradskyella sp.]
MRTIKTIIVFFTMIIVHFANAHPNGNIIVTQNGCVLWSYVSPVGDIDHHASIMLWDQNSSPRLFLKSEYESSDFFLYTKDNDVFIIETRYINSKDIFEYRVLKTSTAFEKPRVLWPWFKDNWDIGVGGFKILSDDQLVFVRHPNIYILNKGKTPIIYFDFPSAINKMRPVAKDKLLLLGESEAWLVSTDGNVLKQWNNLIEEVHDDIPLNRNAIHDIDYSNGNLLIAYWGKRSFEIIDSNNNRKIVLKKEKPWVPHWVAYLDETPLLFSSFLDFKNGFTADMKKSTITPNFLMYSKNKTINIWE